MKILIKGGTGAMGRSLVQILSESGNEIFVTSRVGRSSIGNITYIQGNARDEAFIGNLLLCRWDVVVDFMTYSTSEFKNAAHRLLNSAGQYIFLSSSRVYANSETPITEDSPRLLDVCKDAEYLQTDEYALAKARQENFLRDSGYKNWTIIRPYVTFDKFRLQLGCFEKEAWLYRCLHGRTIVFNGDIAPKLTTMTFGYDVARGMAALVGNSKAMGQAFHVTHSESHTWSEILSVYLDVLKNHFGRQVPCMLIDRPSKLQLKFMKYQIKYDRYFNRKFDNSKIGEFVDVSSFSPPIESLRKCLSEFLEKPKFDGVNALLEADSDRHARETTALGEFSDWRNKLKYIIYRYTDIQ